MKILISGATGFLGQHLCRHLRTQGHELVELHSKTCDLRDQTSLEQYNNERLDQIYHLAAWTRAGDFCLKHPGEQWIINQQINTNVLGWWNRYQPQAKMIAVGSSCCYEPGTAHREENFLSGVPIDSLFTYAMTKRMLYTGLLALHKQFGRQYLFLVPSTLYGPDYHLDGRQMHFIFDLLRKIVRGKLHGESVVLWGDGTQKRELIHVADFVRIGCELAETADNDIFNIGGGAEYSIRWFAEKLAQLVDFDPTLIQYDTSRYIGATSKVLLTDKVSAYLPTLTLLPIEQGLRELVEWYLRTA